MFKKVTPNLNFKEREAETLRFWQEKGIFEKSVEMREGADSFTTPVLLPGNPMDGGAW